MIRINVLDTGPRRTIAIPIGWIFVALFALGICVVLFFINEANRRELEQLQAKVDKVRSQYMQYKNYTSQYNETREKLKRLQKEYNSYTQLLQQRGGGWTPVLKIFEQLLAKAETVWFRQLKIDADGRVDISGVSKCAKDSKKKFPGIVSLLEQIKGKGSMRSGGTSLKFKPGVRVKRIQKAKEKKQEVAQFELKCTLVR